MVIGIDVELDRLLDPQQLRPAGWCEACGAEVWGVGEALCGRCRRQMGMENA